MAAIYLEIKDLFDAKSRSTSFRLVTDFVKIEPGYTDGMIRLDYSFLETIKHTLDEKIKLKFPQKTSLLACNHSKVR